MMYTKGKRRLAGMLALLLCFSGVNIAVAQEEVSVSEEIEDAFVPEEVPVQEGLPEQEIVTDVPLPPEALQPYVEDVPIVRAQMEAGSDDADMPPANTAPNPEAELSYAAETEYFPGFEMWECSQNPSDLYLTPDGLQFPSDGMPVPLLYQYDYRNPVCSMWGEAKSVASSGCGAAAASMVIAYVCGNYDQTPYTLFRAAADDGRYRGNGLSYETVRGLLSDYGVNSQLVGTTRTGILSALSENRPIIIDMGPGAFTNNGHYIVLRGLDENGGVLVNDPNSSWRSRQSYSVTQIVRECKSQCMLVVY